MAATNNSRGTAERTDSVASPLSPQRSKTLDGDERFTHPCGCCSCVCWGLSPSLALSHCSHRGRWTCLCASLVQENVRKIFAGFSRRVANRSSPHGPQSRNVYRLRRIFLGRLVVVFACVSLSLSDGTLACLARRLCTHK